MPKQEEGTEGKKKVANSEIKGVIDPIYGHPWPQGTDTSYLKTSTKLFLNLLFKHCFRLLSLAPPFGGVQSSQVFLFWAALWHSACGLLSSPCLWAEPSPPPFAVSFSCESWGLCQSASCTKGGVTVLGTQARPLEALGTRCACRTDEVK